MAGQISLALVPEGPIGASLLQSVFNHARQYVVESFGHGLSGAEGRQLFELLHRDVDATEHRVYAINLHNGVSKVIGFVTLGLGYSHWDGGYIHFMVLDERYRGQGYAGRAVQLLEEIARAETSKMRLKAYPPESEVVNFWCALGYVQTGRFPVSFEPLEGAPSEYTMLEKHFTPS